MNTRIHEQNFLLLKSAIKKAFLFVAIILSNGACNFNPGNLSSLTWQVDLLGPLVKTELVLEDFLEFQDISLPMVINVGPGDIIINNCPPPPFNCDSLRAPIIIPPTTDTFPEITVFESITFETVDIFMVITNNSPLTIKAGGNLKVTDVSGTPVVDFLVDSDILPGISYTTSISSFQNKIVKNKLSLSIENFTTDSISLPVTFTSNDNIKIEFKIQVIKISSVEANPITFSISDTTDFNMNLEGDAFKTDIAEGEIIIFINNEIPFEIKLQVYFYNADKDTILDSLFDTNKFINASDSSRISVIFSENKFQKISSAKYINIDAQFSIPGPGSQTISKDQKIEFLMVGDLKIKLN